MRRDERPTHRQLTRGTAQHLWVVVREPAQQHDRTPAFLMPKEELGRVGRLPAELVDLLDRPLEEG
jgi:hypothetical protein